MDEDYVRKARTFVRVCLNYATSGVLNLSAEECLHLFKEVFIMADFLQDQDTMMSVCNQIGLLFEKLQLYNEALKYQQLHLTFATEAENKAAQIEAYKNLGNVYLLINKYQDALSCYEKAKSIAIEIGDKESEGGCYGNMGAVYHLLGYHGDAIKSFKQCLAVALETNDTIYQKIAYNNMGVAYDVMKDFPQVINCYEEWLKIATKDDEQEKGEVYERLGNAYQVLNSSHQAIECYEKFLEIAKKLEDQTMERNAYTSLGNFYFTQANFQKAVDNYWKELELAIKLDDKNSEARAYSDLGLAYETLGIYAKAIELSEKAIALAMIIGDKSVEASALKHLGSAYEKQGDYHKAIKCLEHSLQITTDIGSKDGQARAYTSLGMAYQSLGNYYEVVKYQTKALELCVEIGYKQGEAAAHGNLGIAYYWLGQYHDAIVHHNINLEIARTIEDRYGEGRAIGNLGTCFFKIDKFEEAVHCFEEGLKIALEVKDRQSEGIAYGRLGECKIVLGQYNEALKTLDKQICLAEDIGEKSQQATGYGNKGYVYLELNNHQQAIDCFKNELKIAQETYNKSEEANSYERLGILYGDLSLINENNGEQEEKREQCIANSKYYLRESLRCREWLFHHLHEQDHFKISILETFIENYNYLTLLLIRNNEYKEALLASERGRARALDDLLVSKYNLNKDNQSGRHHISYEAIENMASNCSILFYSLQTKFRCTWIISSVHSSAVCIGTDEAGLSDIVNSAYNTLKVREVQCEDRSVEVDGPQEKQNLSVPQKSGVMDVTEKLLLSSYEKMKERCIWDEDLYDDDDNPNPLEGLYKALISPVLHLLTKDEIVIIPDGALFTVPFATLRDPNTGELLSETKRIRLAPSLTSLKALQECPADFHSKTGALIIGNPKVGKVMFRGKTKEIHDLPCAEREAKMIGELLGVKPFIGSQATKEAIKQNLREGVAVIHFAAHGTTDGEIFLTSSTTGGLPSEQDYILTMKEVQESGVRPQLVVLSCCHSGRGEIKAEGVVGMSRAFLAAGARAVVASLWAIADEATMVFMEKFYTHLKQGESASKSLQAAMKDMREIPRYNDPQFWAPFFLIGDDVTIKI